MNRESVAKLQLDRRLISRRGWISSEDLEQALESLPDAAGKMMQENEGDASGAEAAGEGAPTAAPTAGAPD